MNDNDSELKIFVMRGKSVFPDHKACKFASHNSEKEEKMYSPNEKCHLNVKLV
jgi:hypothetical protein